MAQLSEQDLQDVLFARAFEPTDEPGQVLSLVEGEAASRRARAELAELELPAGSAAFIVRRAAALRRRIDELQPQLGAWRVSAVWKGPPTLLIFVLSLALGLGVDRLGQSGRISLLSFPILGLLLWNLTVYVLMFSALLLARKKSGESEGAASRRASGGLLARCVLWCASPERLWRGRAGHTAKADLALRMQRYLRDWFRVASGLFWMRARVGLHLAALGVMAGTIGGMYLRGLVFHYEASWESTFLRAEEVHAFLDFLFAPAAAQMGRAVPDLAEIKKLGPPAGSGEAAFWIHAWALTGLWLVILPRAALALYSSLRAKHMARRIELNLEGDAYFLKLMASDRGQGTRAFVQTYSYAPAARASEGLSSLLLDLFGGRTRIQRLDPREYGDEVLLCDETLAAGACQVLLFSLAQSPELEVHGAHLSRLLIELRARAPHTSLLVVLDEGPFQARLPAGQEGAARLQERRRSWQRVLSDVGLEALFAPLAGWTDPALLERAQEVLLVPAGLQVSP